jgi:hypothetical protein
MVIWMLINWFSMPLNKIPENADMTVWKPPPVCVNIQIKN